MEHINYHVNGSPIMRRAQAKRIRKAVARLDEPNYEGLECNSTEEAEFVVRVVREEGLTVADFVEMDERPVQFDSDSYGSKWFGRLRRARNDPDSRLFAALGEAV
jgi:hypothetical protein